MKHVIFREQEEAVINQSITRKKKKKEQQAYLTMAHLHGSLATYLEKAYRPLHLGRMAATEALNKKIYGHRT